MLQRLLRMELIYFLYRRQLPSGQKVPTPPRTQESYLRKGHEFIVLNADQAQQQQQNGISNVRSPGAAAATEGGAGGEPAWQEKLQALKQWLSCT